MPRTENLTLLLTDIKGFTARTAAQTREENARWLARHRALVRPVVEAFGGTLRQEAGDAFIVTFPSPTNAVLCATALQDRLWAFNRRVPEAERLEIRAVLSQGEVQVGRAKVQGRPLATLKALEPLADAGEVLLDEGVYLSMNRAEVPVEPRGEQRIEGREEPLRLYAVPQLGGGDAPPYAGRGLTRVPDLPDLSEDWIERLREDPEGERARARRAGLAARFDPWRRMPRSLRRLLPVLGVGLLIVLLARVLVGPEDLAERIRDLVDRGALEEAVTALDAFERAHPDREGDLYFLQGYLAMKRGKVRRAARLYRFAIEADPEQYRGDATILEAMVAALEDEDCGVRTDAARTLARLGDRDAVSPLREALARERDRDKGPLGIGRILCRFEAAAEEAIAELER